MKLSVVIPVYNERQYIEEVLRRVQAIDMEKEIVIVDDGSTDGTREFLQNLSSSLLNHVLPISKSQLIEINRPAPMPEIKVLFHERNQGKGAALRTGFQYVTGDTLVIQDADLEYDPAEWKDMFRLILEDKADVVFGSRFYGKPHRVLYYHHYLGNKIICMLINLLCNITLSDVEVCYKMFRREVLNSLHLVSHDFGFEVEFTIKVAKSKKWRIFETAVSYYGRTYAEGKKINWKDGFKTLWYIFRFRFGDLALWALF